MTLINRLLNPVFDLLLRALQPLGTVMSLASLSLVTAIAILLVVRATSDQSALAAVKRQIHADLFEIRLFNDDLRAMLRAEGDILRHNATYLRLSLVPMVWILVPAALAAAQLQSYYAYAGVDVGQPVIVTAQFKPGSQPSAALDAPAAFRVDTPAISLPALNQVVWRIVGTAPGDYELQLRIADDAYAKTIHVSDGLARRSPMRLAPRLLDEITYPSEAPLPASAPISMIRVDYPQRGIQVLGRPVHWMVVYLTLSVVFAVVLRRPLRVTI
jgi:uncharacterized membrane protein (DUF106 family)